MIQNIGKLFYKDYYKSIDFSYILDKSKEGSQDGEILKMNNLIKRSGLVKIEIKDLEEKNRLPVNSHFLGIVAYPGLITGTGIVHDSKKLKGGYNLGMHFDYTYGMPIIYGSSIKGVLRNYFKQARTTDYDDDLFTPILQKGIDIDELFEDIFNGKILQVNSDGKPVYINKSIYRRDTFFDAVIVKEAEFRRGNESIKYIVADDSITPHKDGPLKDPVPITMLKIAPGCTIEFRFHLNDFTSKDGKDFKSKEKEELFKSILERVGIGAKTNVGYGQLEEAQKDK